MVLGEGTCWDDFTSLVLLVFVVESPVYGCLDFEKGLESCMRSLGTGILGLNMMHDHLQ